MSSSITEILKLPKDWMLESYDYLKETTWKSSSPELLPAITFTALCISSIHCCSELFKPFETALLVNMLASLTFFMLFNSLKNRHQEEKLSQQKRLDTERKINQVKANYTKRTATITEQMAEVAADNYIACE